MLAAKKHLKQHLCNWQGLNMRVYKAPGTMWEESDGDMKTVVKDNLRMLGGGGGGVLLWEL